MTNLLYTKSSMYFYEVSPASRQYHGMIALTYQSEKTLKPGEIVVVKIRTKSVPAFILKQVEQPTFKTTEISMATGCCLPPQHLQLAEWLTGYYPAPLGIISQLFLPLSKASEYDTGKIKPKPQLPTITPPPTLTREQKAALKDIEDAHSTVILHGDTGTGKTRLYVERASQVLAAGKSVLILVPEIALSPQTVQTFTKHLNAPVTVTHSGLTPAQRRTAWHHILGANEPQVVIGPRSALFSPINNLGLIVMDEFHEPAYKQDQAPYYQTIRAASQLAGLHHAQLILGSATPPVSEYYIAEHKNIPIIRMIEKAAQHPKLDLKPLNTILVNLKDSNERSQFPLISMSLIEALKTTLESGEQALLFLNKRGSARMILCQACGWHAVCPRCDLPLTYHGDSYRLQCHTCGYSTATPSVCPSCSSHDIVFKSPGTKAIVDAIQYLFPEARIARFDKDNLKAERLDSRHEEIVDGSIDILIGTQLLAKGHDLPRLSLVGILLAENELQFPDYSASERSYQLMHQLIGRVGRGHRDGTVVVQTYDPDSLAVQTALQKQSWQDFYQAQITERQHFAFPPFAYLLKIEVSRAREATVHNTCQQIIDHIKTTATGSIEITGPTPSFIERRNNTLNWQIVIKAKQRSTLTALAQSIGSSFNCTINLDPINLL